jgi:CubicO group peptidase (beta-lactamase class C family)
MGHELRSWSTRLQLNFIWRSIVKRSLRDIRMHGGHRLVQLDTLGGMQARLDDLARQCGVPGAVLGILEGENVALFATGEVNSHTRVRTTTDTLFQIGSITKLLTATLIMRLVDEGKVELRSAVGEYLPEWRVDAKGEADAITILQLLTHSSGMAGDYFEDFGRGDDAVERYVRTCPQLPLVYPPGLLYSYCNTGFVVLGRIIERIRGFSWDEALHRELSKPLGLNSLVTFAEDAVLHRVAVGHFVDGEGVMARVSRRWALPRALGPAGTTACGTASDLLRFARLHLEGGRTPGGLQVLSIDCIEAMQEPLVPIPWPQPPNPAQGLGWRILDWTGERVLNHNGGTSGQQAFLYVLPERQFAVVVLTNSEAGGVLCNRLLAEVVSACTPVRLPKPIRPQVEMPVVDLTVYVGTYERLNMRIEIAVEDGKLMMKTTVGTRLADLIGSSPEAPVELRPISVSAFFVVGSPADPPGEVVMFLDFVDGRPQYVLHGGRVSRRE